MNTSVAATEKKLKNLTWVVTALVVVLVGVMRQVKIPLPEGISFTFLPPFYSALNALAAVALLMSLFFIKQRNIKAHRAMNMTALGLSVLFLLCYVLYHFTTPATVYGDTDGDGLLNAAETAAVAGTRTWYLLLLASHIVLAAASLPFILFTFIKAYTEQFEQHRRLARWVWPVWFYVCVTGPVCYWMLKPYYVH